MLSELNPEQSCLVLGGGTGVTHRKGQSFLEKLAQDSVSWKLTGGCCQKSKGRTGHQLIFQYVVLHPGIQVKY